MACRDGGDDLFVPRSNLHGAQHGDIVLCKPTTGDQVEVVKVLQRGITTLTGTLQLDHSAFVLPDDEAYFSDIHCSFVPKDAKNGQKVVVRITDWAHGKNPEGEITKILGLAGERTTEVLSTLYAYGFSDTFDTDVLSEADSLHMDASEEDREDLTHLLTITIDGEDARDFDDAISVSKTPAGYLLWVHIADVSHFVKPGTRIDDEAYRRATSVYFPRRAYPMLPEVLSNGLCSLVPDEERYCLSACMLFDELGERKSVRLTKSVIKSDARMTYNEVQKILDGDQDMSSKYAHITDFLRTARALAALLSAQRTNRGAIDFSTTESVVLFENDEVVGVAPYRTGESHHLIEEFMIATNEAVASTLEGAGYPCVYRVHDLPAEDKLKQLTAFAGCFGLAPERRYLNPDEIAGFIRESALDPAGAIISQVAIRCMQKAEYTPENIGHYGLGSECYCHFTSPIRRYPDLLVHRLVKRYLADKAKGVGMSADEKNSTNADLVRESGHCSERERSAEKAERSIMDYYMSVYMCAHVGETYDAVVSGVNANMIFATLPNGVEGAIATDSLNEGYYFDPMRYSLISERRSFRLGDPIRVMVESSNPTLRRVRFALVENGSARVRNPIDVRRRFQSDARGSSQGSGHKSSTASSKTGNRKPYVPKDHRKPKSSGKGKRR